MNEILAGNGVVEAAAAAGMRATGAETGRSLAPAVAAQTALSGETIRLVARRLLLTKRTGNSAVPAQ